MQGYNIIAVFDPDARQLLMCRRETPPYQGLLNFIGGKIEPGEDGLSAAYRELEEETAITREDITLTHLMDSVYPLDGYYLEVYAGRLIRPVPVFGEENPLLWCRRTENFFATDRFAGRGLLGHILMHIEAAEGALLGRHGEGEPL